MPIRWNGTISSSRQLASVIQGEAATPAGQFGVASVMYNRLNAPGFGSDITSVVTPRQFNGYDPNPSAHAQSLADDLWAGRAPSGGDTGNALFFANPRGSTASWATDPNFAATGVNVGGEGNLYSDRMGVPSGDFRAPSYGASGYTPDWAEGSPGMFTAAGGQPTLYGGSGMTDAGGPLAGVTQDSSGNSLRYATPGDSITAGVAGGDQSLFGDANIPGAGGLAQVNSGAIAPAGTGQDATLKVGAPINITDASFVGQAAGNSVEKGLNNLSGQFSGTVNNATQAVITAATSLIGSTEATASDLLIRGGLFLVAAVFLIGAWMFYSVDNRGGGNAVAA